jgi:hypothetical protein
MRILNNALDNLVEVMAKPCTNVEVFYDVAELTLEPCDLRLPSYSQRREGEPRVPYGGR